ncbi:MAG: J domain-containing protein [Deltaproteobacteria bacterium]|nr:J domain-containing protein [Deltaproteobacteria bacterium]
MVIGRRLVNLLRAEINARIGRFRDLDAADGEAGDGAPPEPPRRPRARAERLRQYYANLELADGASWPEVKSAYRRLMRRYHPDRHAADPAKARLANELSQKLRVAYEELRQELTGR